MDFYTIQHATSEEQSNSILEEILKIDNSLGNSDTTKTGVYKKDFSNKQCFE